MQSMKEYMYTKIGFNSLGLIISISNINIKIPYSDFVKIIETKNLYLMKTKAAKEGNPVIIKKTHYLMCQKRT